MDSTRCNKVQPTARKVKKKQVKDEQDRIKQAEKKKRRLEKALATSLAIRSELENKKKTKMEEQQRLDEESAAIAEAVALNVLLGEDSDDPCEIVLNKEFNPWGYDLFMGRTTACFPLQTMSNGYGSQGNSYSSFSDEPYRVDFHTSYSNMGFSAGLIAAQAISSLKISDDAEVDTMFIDGMFRG